MADTNYRYPNWYSCNYIFIILIILSFIFPWLSLITEHEIFCYRLQWFNRSQKKFWPPKYIILRKVWPMWIVAKSFSFKCYQSGDFIFNFLFFQHLTSWMRKLESYQQEFATENLSRNSKSWCIISCLKMLKKIKWYTSSS